MASGITKPAEFFKVSKTRALPLDDSIHATSEISYDFFMPIIAKCQPLHRPSIQSPPTIAAIFIFDVIADKVHISQ